MQLPTSRQGRLRPGVPSARRARTEKGKPLPIPQSWIEDRILESVRSAPRTAGEITGYVLTGKIPKARRDEAIDSLLKRGLIRIQTKAPCKSQGWRTLELLVFVARDGKGVKSATP